MSKPRAGLLKVVLAAVAAGSLILLPTAPAGAGTVTRYSCTLTPTKPVIKAKRATMGFRVTCKTAPTVARVQVRLMGEDLGIINDGFLTGTKMYDEERPGKTFSRSWSGIGCNEDLIGADEVATQARIEVGGPTGWSKWASSVVVKGTC